MDEVERRLIDGSYFGDGGMRDTSIDIPEVTARRGGYSFTDGPDIAFLSGGWCAPSDQVYDFLGEDAPPRTPDCPDWNGFAEDACEYQTWDGPTEKSWHSCKDEYRGPHAVCVCEDCGATRVIVQESKGA